MSDQPHITPGHEAPVSQPPVKPRHRLRLHWRIARGTAWLIAGVVLLLAILVGAVSWYTTTPDFQRRVGKEVVQVLEDATGGKVELNRISLNLWHLAIEADGLVVHGLEGPGEAPYLSADRILIRLKLVSLLHRTAGGAASHVGLNLLRVEQPRVHLIIDKDGKTNQPTPKHPSQSNEPVIDTLLDLKAKEVELVNGVALLNDKAIPFNLAARDLNAQVQYLSRTNHYGATIDLTNLVTQIQKQPEAHSQLHLEAEVGRDMAALKNFTFHTGDSSHLEANASLEHFAHPDWQAQVKGTIEIKQIAVLSGVDGLNAGTIDVDVAGHNCNTTPQVAQKHPRFWERLHPRDKKPPPSAKVLPPDPDCQKGYLLVGSAKMHNVGYKDEFVRLHDINGGAQLHITPTELLFTALTGYLPGGGSAAGDLKIVNWLGEVPADTAPVSATVAGAVTTANKTAVAVTGKSANAVMPTVAPVAGAHAYLTVTVARIPLRTIMDIAAPKGYGDLGFDTSINGPVKVEWGGPVTDVADSVLVDADLKLAPTGVRRGPANIPVSGHILGHYDGKTEVVLVKQLNLNTPESTLTANGVLGVNLGDRLTSLQVDLAVRDFGEYDQLLKTLGLTANGKKGAAAIPVVLHGSASFHGTAKGAIAKLDVKGHLEAQNVEVRLDSTPPAPVAPTKKASLLAAVLNSTPPPPAPPAPPTLDVLIDSLVADAEYTPQGLAVASSTITRKSAVLNVEGSFKPRVEVRRHVTSYVWDDGTSLDLKVQLANADVTDLLQLAGQQQNYPVSGTIAVNANASGLLRTLNGGGTVALTNGVAYGEPFDSVNVTASVTGKQIEATKLAVRLHGMAIDGNGGYNLTTQKLHAHVQGDNLVLSKFKSIQDRNLNADGTISLVADANGTVTEPGLTAHIGLANLAVQGKPIGSATVDAHSQGKIVSYTAKSSLVGAEIDATGQTELEGDYQTKAQLTLAHLDVGVPLALFQPDSTKVTSNISGVVNIAGPAKNPTGLTGSVAFDHFEATAQGITLKTAEPLRIGLKNGIATLEQVHITGTDTDLRASGTAQVFGASSPNGGALNIQSNGSINVGLAHTFDPDVISSGKITFAVGVGGALKNPALSGKINFEKVNIALDGIPNGLSNMNGSLVFNEDRLTVQNLTATTGGGVVKMGGFLTYKNGFYADLTANAEVVRIRYNGISGTANANFRLQGTGQTALLSGSILLTRFGIGPDVDFAAFAGGGGVSAPPDPTAFTNKIRLDIKVASSPQLDFQNSYAKLAGNVDLSVRGTAAEPTVLGRIQITDGSATFAGTKYQLQRGDIYFTNPVRIDPTIDLDVTARVETYDVTVGLHGTASNLKPTYRSEPPLSETDVFALLALGRTQEEAQIYQEQQVQAGTDPAASSLLGGALNATVSSRVSKLFGGGSVKIDPAFVGTLGNSSARITVQQQLSRQLTLTYATNVNSSAEQLISVQYDLTPNVSIVATRDESDVFSVVYKIRRRYR